MKTSWIAKGAFAAIALSGFVIGGLGAYVYVANRHLPPSGSGPDSVLVFRDHVDHPVTPAMERAAQELGGAKAPSFAATDLQGKNCSLASLTTDRPLVLFFVELHCPCCKGAKPYIDRIQRYYGDRCNVVGVINAKPDMALAWSKTVQPRFDVIPDPDMKIIRAYRAQRGVYTTLVAPGGRIVKAYPGYSQSMLREITTSIARLAGVKARPMPIEPAPKRMTSGCLFPGTKLPGDEP
jgi:peroxiredoxin